MSLLHRRGHDGSHEDTSLEATASDKAEELRVVSVAKLKALSGKKSKRRNGLIFGLGGLFGIIIAAFFANQNDVIKFDGLMDLNLDSLLDVIPAGIIRDAKELTVGMLQRAV
jgi:phospholipid:diacylglycerol acyltransferase